MTWLIIIGTFMLGGFVGMLGLALMQIASQSRRKWNNGKIKRNSTGHVINLKLF